MKKSLAKNAFYKAILNIFNLIVPALITPYILSIPLQKADYNMYNRVFSEFSTFLIFAALGIYTYGMREISRIRENVEKMNKLFTSLFTIGLLSNVVTIFIYFIYASFRSDGSDFYLYLIFIIQFIGNIFCIEFINEAVENYRFITIKTIVVRIIYLVSILLFVNDPEDIMIYAAIVNLTVLGNNLVSYLYLKKSVHFDFHKVEIKKHLVPLCVAMILANIEILYTRLDTLLLGYFISDAAVTDYSLTYNIVAMIGTLPLALITVAIPRVSHLIAIGDKESYVRILRSTVEVYMGMIIPLCFGIIVLAQEILDIYTQGMYVSAYVVLIVMAISRISIGYESILNNLIMYTNRMERQMTYFLLAFGFLNLVIDILLIAFHMFNPTSAIASTALVILALDISMNLYIKRKLNYQYQLVTWKIIRYFLICILFIPIAYLIRTLQLPYYIYILTVMLACASLYIAYLLITKDELLYIFLRKLHIVH